MMGNGKSKQNPWGLTPQGQHTRLSSLLTIAASYPIIILTVVLVSPIVHFTTLVPQHIVMPAHAKQWYWLHRHSSDSLPFPLSL